MDDSWWRSAVVYQIYPRSFADGDGDGVGDLAGVLQHVDHLAALGVDVVWFSPLYRSPMDDNGYDISDYQDIDPVFGTLEQFDEVLAALHERGIKVVMDLVVNHTSDEHAWFVESRSSLDNPKRDWYFWRDRREDGSLPNNWSSYFGGPAWEPDELTDQCYLHLFSRKQPDLNWENPEVREAVYAMMRWWLDRGVDGFRMDVINMISKTDGLPDGTPGSFEGILGGDQYLNGPRIHEYLHEMHEQVFGGREGAFLTVGEMPGVTTDEARLYTDPARAEVDMVFQFEHVALDGGPEGKYDLRPMRMIDLKRNFAKWQEALADVGWNSLYYDNHDQPRAVSRFGDDSPVWRERSATALATVLHLQRGTPYVYQGEELGMTNVPFGSIDDFRDIEALNHYAAAVAAGNDPEDVLRALRIKSRDNARTPVQWTAGAYAGFGNGEPWISVNPNHDVINAEAQVGDPASVFGHFRRLIDLRHTEPVVALGDFTLLLPDDERVFAFTRSYEGVDLLVLANFSRDDLTVDLEGWDDATYILGNHPQPPAAVTTLRGWESTVWRR